MVVGFEVMKKNKQCKVKSPLFNPPNHSPSYENPPWVFSLFFVFFWPPKPPPKKKNSPTGFLLTVQVNTIYHSHNVQEFRPTPRSDVAAEIQQSEAVSRRARQDVWTRKLQSQGGLTWKDHLSLSLSLGIISEHGAYYIYTRPETDYHEPVHPYGAPSSHTGRWYLGWLQSGVQCSGNWCNRCNPDKKTFF